MSRPPRRGRPWLASDRTGGPADAVLDLVRARHAGLVVERWTVVHAGDDDNVYFLGDAGRLDAVQVDTSSDGRPPFLIAGDDSEQYVTSDPVSAAATIVALLDGEPVSTGTPSVPGMAVGLPELADLLCTRVTSWMPVSPS